MVNFETILINSLANFALSLMMILNVQVVLLQELYKPADNVNAMMDTLSLLILYYRIVFHVKIIYMIVQNAIIKTFISYINYIMLGMLAMQFCNFKPNNKIMYRWLPLILIFQWRRIDLQGLSWSYFIFY